MRLKVKGLGVLLVRNPKGPRTQIVGFQGPNTTIFIVLGP